MLLCIFGSNTMLLSVTLIGVCATSSVSGLSSGRVAVMLCLLIYCCLVFA